MNLCFCSISLRNQGSFFAALTALFLGNEVLLLGAEWFVAPEGTDTASGRAPEPRLGVVDGPFATLERARDAVREQLKAGDGGPHTVHVRGGTYRLRDALKLDSRDSGSEAAPVVWRAYLDEKPLVTGAVPLRGWKVWKGAIQRAELGSDVTVRGGIRQLIAGGQRQILARYPNIDPADPVAGGWAFADGKSWPMYAEIPGEDKRTLEVLPGDLRRWSKPAEAEVVVFPRFNWWNDRVRIMSVDEVARKVRLAGDCSYAIRKGDRYFIQNAIEELDSPGEWYADMAEGAVYFWPPAGMDPAEAAVVVAPGLLVMEAGAHDIVWKGFTMEGCNGTAVSMQSTARCALESSWIRNVGDWAGNGVGIFNGESNRVSRNVIEKVGRTAVSLSGGSVATLKSGNNVAEHNQIRDFGLYFKQGVGIDISQVGNKALHNEIERGPRFGVMHRGNRHEIGWNHIHHVCLETEDTGAIYSGGRDWITPRGTAIYYNWIHDIPGFSMHEGRVLSPHFAWGIYLDDNSGGADVYGNIVARCGRGGMHGHGARDCVVSNNIFIENKDWQFDFHGWTTQQSFWEKHFPTMVKGYESVAGHEAWKAMRGMDLHPADAPLPDGLTMRGNVFVQNVVVSTREETPVMSILRVPFSHNRFDYNLYWCPGGRVVTGHVSAGPDEGGDLLPRLDGEEGDVPRGWRWSTKAGVNPKAGLRKKRGDASLVLSSDPSLEKPGQMVFAGPDISLVPGNTYRLRARVRASASAKVVLGVHSFVSKAYFWMSPGGSFAVGTDWSDCEVVFTVPSPGSNGWHEQMKHFSPRISWSSGGGTLEVTGMRVHQAAQRSSWDAWRDFGVDAHSVVADPLWEDPRRYTLGEHSPAWALGFRRIPVESIGPQAESP